MAFNATTFNEVCQRADDIHASNNAGGQASAYTVAAIKAPGANLDETQPGISYPVPEVAAIQRGGRGRGRGRGRGGRQSRGGSSQQSGGPRQYKGAKHPDLPAGDWTGCNLHYKFG